MAGAEPLELLKRAALEAIDRLEPELLLVSHEIHAHPELAFEEHRAAALLIDALRKGELDVEAGAYGLATAFAAEFGAAEGPLVAVLAEYDALPEIGHSCGHNLIAASALGAGLALSTLREHLPGRVRVLGTPAEERGGGKELMARSGAFDGVDAALMMHPSSVDLVTMPCVALAEVQVVYRGRSAHAAAMPERGVNALDALVTAYQAIAQLRQHIQANERLHGIITRGGDAPNIVPEIAEGRFYVRAANERELEVLRQRVIGCFEAGARATGAELELRWGDVDYLEIRRNAPLEDAFRSNAEQLGRRFFPIEQLPASLAGSTDMGNISHRVPSIHPMLAAAPMHCTIHNAEFAEHARAEIGDRAAIDGAKALAMTALDVLVDGDLRERAKAIFEAGG
jgi:amidohydrolase